MPFTLVHRIMVAATSCLMAGAAFAQSAAPPSTRTTADAPQDRPGVPTTRDLNHISGMYAAMGSREQARYRMDRRAYVASVMQHRLDVRRYHRRYVHREIAYAEAMAMWRRQVRACHNGDRAACAARTPRTADFY